MVKDAVPVRDSLVKRLEANTALQILCPTIWGEKQPAETPWPFIRYGVPIITPEEWSGGLTGGRHRVTLHTFARGPSMDACAAIMAVTEDELDGSELALVYPEGDTREASAFELFLNGSQIIPDGDDDWHGIQEFDLTVAGA